MEIWPLNRLNTEQNNSEESHDKDPNSPTEAASSDEKSKKREINNDDDRHDDKEEDDDDYVDGDQPVKEERVITNKELLMYFAKNTSMHGIPTIVGSKLYQCRPVFWACVVSVLAVLLGAVVYFQMSNYYEYPTVTSMDIHYVGEKDFPSITFCNLNYFDGELVRNYTDIFTAVHLSRLTEITGFYHRFSENLLRRRTHTASKKTSGPYIEELLNKTLERASRSMFRCSWGDNYWTRCNASRTRITDMGVCVTIDVQKLSKQKNGTSADDSDSMPAIGNALRGLTMYVDVSSDEIPERIYQYQGFKVVLHDPDEEPLPLSSGFLVNEGTTVEVEVSKTVVKIGLPSPYKAFGSGTCVDTLSSSFDNPLSRFQKYSKEVCESECFINFVVEVCGGCRHFLHPGNESICPVNKLADCFRTAEKRYYAGHMVDGGKGRSECKCPMPCTQTTYQASVTAATFTATKLFTEIQQRKNVTLNHTTAYLHFFYAVPIVVEMRQVAVFSTTGLLGTIGGQVGLFMGFSLVTVAEMLELIFLLVTRKRNLDQRVKQHKISGKAGKPFLPAKF